VHMVDGGCFLHKSTNGVLYDTCLEHMQDYKEICEKISLSIDLNVVERTMRCVGLKSQLQTLKDLHDT
jgi:hypothetical protein